jgi:glycosyltransferase involved in cell wall biosynthesis
MKVLMVSRWFWEECRRNGGTSGFFGELAQAIVAKGIDLTILSQADDAGAIPELRLVNGLKVYVFSREGRRLAFLPLDKIIKMWSGYRKAATDAGVIRKFVKQQGPFDAVVAQCEEPDGLSCALATFVGEFPPIVTFVHDLRYNFQPNGIRFIRKSSLGFVFRKSARVVANSVQTAGWLQREYSVPQTKIGQCRIHLTAPFLAMAAQSTVTSKVGSQRILFLGALNRKKAPDIFLRAAILLTPQLPEWKFVLVGPETSEDHAFRAILKELASHSNLVGHLELLGRLESSAVMDQIHQARVVVCPSRIETFSRTTIEALVLERPVIVSKTTGAAHWVEATGCGSVVPPEDPDALARVILEWTTRAIPSSMETMRSQLTVSVAAEDWIREVSGAGRTKSLAR